MKYIKDFISINEGWQITLKSEIDYKREDDIREVLSELNDIGLEIQSFKKRLCDDSFYISDNRIKYNSEPLYPRYTFKLISERNYNPDKQIEIMQNITECLERLRGFGYKVNIDGLKIQHNKENPTKFKFIMAFEFSVYHIDDQIPWEMIFISRSERGLKEIDKEQHINNNDSNDDTMVRYFRRAPF